MLNLKWLKIFSITTSTFISVPFITTSCSSANKFCVDGTNWIGWLYGSFYPDGYFINHDNKTVTYTNGLFFCAENLIIPDQVFIGNEYYDVHLGEGCFANNRNLIGKVTLNKFTKDIPNRCFYDSQRISQIILTSNIERIGDYAFYNCYSLHTISDSEKNLTHVKEIGDYAFYKCILDAKLVFYPELKKIGDYAFYHCSGLQSADLTYCNSIEKIGKHTFSDCENLLYVSFGQNLARIDDYAFANCKYLQFAILSRSDLTLALGKSAFVYCGSFQGFSQSCKFSEIGEGCFHDCKKLLNFPISALEHPYLTTIPEYAFAGLPFSHITFPPNIKYILKNSFFNNNELKVIDFSRYPIDEPPIIAGSTTFSESAKEGIIYVPKNCNMHLWQEALINKGIDLLDGWRMIQG